MKTYVSAKLHGIRVTHKSVRYHGSVAIAADLMKLAGIEEYEKVDVVNLNNGNRWSTYAIPASPGVFSLNGGGARLGEIDDECVIMTYAVLSEYVPARVVHLREDNSVVKEFLYEQTGS